MVVFSIADISHILWWMFGFRFSLWKGNWMLIISVGGAPPGPEKSKKHFEIKRESESIYMMMTNKNGGRHLCLLHYVKKRTWEPESTFFSAQLSTQKSTLAREHLKNCSKKRPKKYSRLRVPKKALKKALKKVLNKQLSPESAQKSTLKACSKNYSKSRVLKKVSHKSRDSA